ncbi:ATP-dependent DNA helicase [Trichonephila clavata]|uniref:ATP-dependent DNA helicase n=1 Tax=Trichonephila clavata TaxID=2740835 RepID=A0A8X6FPX8_TRICU|nr:ATP-dependent DNA helicase [Trichonephila clavata]
MPKYYTWNQSSRRFIRRKQGKPVPGYTNVYSTDAIGRIYSVHPSNDECFYLRLLLVNVRGPTSFQQLRTVDGDCVDPTEKPVNVCNCLKMTLIGIKLSMML